MNQVTASQPLPRMAFRFSGLLICFALAFNLYSCKSRNNTQSASSSVAQESALSYIGKGVVERLKERSNVPMRGRTWNVTSGNTFLDNWLLPTPLRAPWGVPVSELAVTEKCSGEGCDPDFGIRSCAVQDDCKSPNTVCAALRASVTAIGMMPRKMCLGHSDEILDQVYDIFVQADEIVDMTSLQPPDGRFEAAIRNAVTFVSRKIGPPRIRILFGTFPVAGIVKPDAILEKLTRNVSPGSNLDISVSAMRSNLVSWNHSKIVAADGKVSLVGGHNMWTQHYLDINPVHDMSMKIHGPAAVSAHQFANELWTWTCGNLRPLVPPAEKVAWIARRVGRLGVRNDCPPSFHSPDDLSNGGKTTGAVIGIGRLGKGISDAGNQADDAIFAMIDAAQNTVRMSLQDIGPMKAPIVGVAFGDWPEELLKTIGAALARKVKVKIILSNKGALGGGLGPLEAPYSNGWTLEDVAKKLRDAMTRTQGLGRSEATALICAGLALAPLRYSADSTWGDGVAFASHVKSVSVDEQAFYVGSQNLYRADLQEFGFIVDDQEATKQYLSRYWDHVWQASEPEAISGRNDGKCAI